MCELSLSDDICIPIHFDSWSFRVTNGHISAVAGSLAAARLQHPGADQGTGAEALVDPVLHAIGAFFRCRGGEHVLLFVTVPDIEARKRHPQKPKLRAGMLMPPDMKQATCHDVDIRRGVARHGK